MSDRRTNTRYGVCIEGKLMSPDISVCLDVVIRNISETGAMVTVQAPIAELPERVYLWQAKTRTLFECLVQWRNSDRLLGLRFTEECSRVSVRDLLHAAVPDRDKSESLVRVPTEHAAPSGLHVSPRTGAN